MDKEGFIRSFTEALKSHPEAAAKLAIAHYSSSVFSSFLQVLTAEPPTPHSMIAVYLISSQIELPPEFLYVFVYEGILKWKNQNSKDSEKSVRIFCIFIRALADSKLIFDGKLLGQIKEFTDGFKDLPEAKTLLRSVKEVQMYNN